MEDERDELFDEEDPTIITGITGSVPVAPIDEIDTPPTPSNPGLLAQTIPPGHDDDPWVKGFKRGVEAGIRDITVALIRDLLTRGLPFRRVEAYVARIRKRATEVPTPLPPPDRR